MNSETEKRLAAYGTLQPGRSNHHQLAGLRGAWSSGVVRGSLREEGWGSALGYPGLTLDPGGDRVEVSLFTSDDLPDHWPRLDAFEGNGYRRVATTVSTPQGNVEACIYVLATKP